MRRSLIAVCLLLLTPSSVQACYEDHNAGEGWFDEHSARWSNYGVRARAAKRDRLLDMSIFAGGSGVLILLSVFMRTLLRAARPARPKPSMRLPAYLSPCRQTVRRASRCAFW